MSADSTPASNTRVPVDSEIYRASKTPGETVDDVAKGPCEPVSANAWPKHVDRTSSIRQALDRQLAHHGKRFLGARPFRTKLGLGVRELHNDHCQCLGKRIVNLTRQTSTLARDRGFAFPLEPLGFGEARLGSLERLLGLFARRQV